MDLITEDISRPWYEHGAIINEVNYASLLGGHRTSARARGYPSRFLEFFFHRAGCLPIEVYVGGDRAMEAALQRQRQLLDDGFACYASNHLTTFRPDGSVMPIAGDGALFARTLSLTADKGVEALVLAIQTDEFLHSGLPMGRLAAVRIIDKGLVSAENPGRRVSDSAFRQLKWMLEAFCPPADPVKGTPVSP